MKLCLVKVDHAAASEPTAGPDVLQGQGEVYASRVRYVQVVGYRSGSTPGRRWKPDLDLCSRYACPRKQKNKKGEKTAEGEKKESRSH